jgi:hypothetical protein
MSDRAIELQKNLTQRQFERDRNCRTVTIVGSEPLFSFPALFTMAFMSDNRDRGHVAQQKRWPHLTFFSGYEDHFEARVTRVSFGGENYLVHSIQTDLGDGTYQGELWLTERTKDA